MYLYPSTCRVLTFLNQRQWWQFDVQFAAAADHADATEAGQVGGDFLHLSGRLPAPGGAAGEAAPAAGWGRAGGHRVDTDRVGHNHWQFLSLGAFGPLGPATIHDGGLTLHKFCWRKV